jgi:hypothetical protein
MRALRKRPREPEERQRKKRGTGESPWSPKVQEHSAVRSADAGYPRRQYQRLEGEPTIYVTTRTVAPYSVAEADKQKC